MALTATEKHAVLDYIGTRITHVSAHTGDPSTTGANEVAGGSYARQPISWNAASAGNLDSSNVPAIPIPAGTTVTHIGYWSASSGGTFRGAKALGASEVFGAAGTLSVTDLDIALSDA